MSYYPYAEQYPVNRTLPEHGRSRTEVLSELREIAGVEDAPWESGHISGSYYCGDHEHYSFLTQVFGLYAYVNALQRDVCPSATRFEGEIIAMTLDILHAESVADGTPCGVVTTGGTGSIIHALLAYREHARQQRGLDRPNVIKAETGHPAFNKGCHLLGIELRVAPIDPETTTARVDEMAALIDDNTIAIDRLRVQLRVRHDRPDRGALGPGARSGRRAACRRVSRRVHPAVGPGARIRHPTVRFPGAGRDEHLGRHPQVRLRVQGGVGRAPSATSHCATPSTST